MRVSEIIDLMLRRWVFTLVILLAAAAAAVGGYSTISPTYEARTSIVLLPPKGGPDQVVNPYLNLTNLNSAADVVVGALSTEEIVQRVGAEAPGATFVVSKDPNVSAPFIVIVADAPDPRAAMLASSKLAAMVPEQLDQLQASANVGAASRISSRVVTASPKPMVINKSRIRSVAVLTILTLGAGGALLILFDLRSKKRIAARAKRTAPVPSRPTGPPPRRQGTKPPARDALAGRGGADADDAPVSDPDPRETAAPRS